MAKTLLQSTAASQSIGASVSSYKYLLGNNRANGNSTEATRTHIWRSAGTLTNLYINVITNDRGASTYRTRKATANGSLVASITASTTGSFEDVTNNDVVTAGDDWHSVITTGAGGTVFTHRIISCLFSATTNTVQRIGCSSTDIQTASATRFAPFYGGGLEDTGDTESATSVTLRTAATLRNLYVYVASNARNTTTMITSRKNSAAGAMSVSIISAATGSFEDTSNSDTLAIGDTINWASTTGANAGLLSAQIVAVDLITTNSQFQLVCGETLGATQLISVTTYYGIAGQITSTSTTESNMQAESNLGFTSSLMQCNITANTISEDSTIRLRKNTDNGNQVVTITASTTGVFQDTTNTDVILGSDIIDYSLVTGTVGTSLVIRNISILGGIAVSPGIMTTRSGYWGDL